MQLLNGNYIDLIIILILIYYISEAFRHGFWIILVDFISFFGSLVLSLQFYQYVSDFLKINFSLNLSISNAIGFLISAIIFEYLLSFGLGYLLHKLPEKIKKHRLNRFFGIIPALGEGAVIISFLLTIIMVLPVRPQFKNDIDKSQIGSSILQNTAIFEKLTNQIFGGVINDSLTYFTVRKNSSDSVSLQIDSFDLSVDENAERELFSEVNKERRKLAIPELTWEENLVSVARVHANDMWKRKYFSHMSPEGDDVGDRLRTSGINYNYAGENLALAPTIKTAHNGLMNSKGHRENILDSKFTKIGIGVIDNGVYGKMFVQVFTD